MILVTGGAGFIGSHIVDLLCEKGYEVIVFDNLYLGKRENVNENAVFIEGDLLNDDDIISVFRKYNIDCVFHQAAQVNLRFSIANPVFDASNNIIATLNLLEACRKFGVRKIIFASSGGAVYGEPKYLPVDENHALNPISPYGASKVICEHYINTYNKLYGLNYVILRYSNVYGERQNIEGEAGVISIFIDKLMKNEKPVIFGDGMQTRDFIYVKDVAKANLLALERKEAENNTFNIGYGKETSVNDIFLLIKKSINKNIEPIRKEKISGEVRRIYLNIEKAKEKLKWKPETELENGIKKTVEWFKRKK